MPATITVEEAQAHLKELIGKLAPGEEVVITEGQRPVAMIVGQGVPARKRGLGLPSLARRARMPGV